MKLEIVKRERAEEISDSLIKKDILFFKRELVKKKILTAGQARKKLTLAFISPAEIKKLNFQYLKKKKATDVLSFSPLEKDSLGELALCPQKIKAQSQEHGLNFQEEMMYLILHGILHLLGYDHETNAKEAEKMYRIQDSIFKSWQENFCKK